MINGAKDNNGATYIQLENNQKVLLPPTVTKVPALLLLNRGHHVLFGDSIYQHLQPQEIASIKKATVNNCEPLSFCLDKMTSGQGFGVVSDNFSFLDQSSDELLARGDGGLRQLHHYATLDHRDTIDTPPDNYAPDKLHEGDLERYESERNSFSTQQ